LLVVRVRFITLACSTWLLLLATGEASAFCRSTLRKQVLDVCNDEPSDIGFFWKRSCLTYTFNEQFFAQLPLLSEAEIREAFRQAFASWRAVDCGQGSDAFWVEQATATTKLDKSEFIRGKPNTALVRTVSRDEWATLPDHSSNALALTLVWHSSATGEIFDTDMELNLGAGRFTDCLTHGCQRDMLDLQNTVTHEAGHVLGLGHSPVTGSTMALRTTGLTETSKRSLEADDRAGYCALDLPSWNCRGANCSCPAPPSYAVSSHKTSSGGCGVVRATARPGVAAWVLAVALIASVRQRRRRMTHDIRRRPR
jgi:Matrixin